MYVVGNSSVAPFRGFVSHLFGGKAGALSYDGCVSDDGDGGACADIPGTGKPLEGTAGIAVSPNGRSVYVTSTAGFVDHLFADATGGQLTWDGCVSHDGTGGTCLNANEPVPRRFDILSRRSSLSLHPGRLFGHGCIWLQFDLRRSISSTF